MPLQNKLQAKNYEKLFFLFYFKKDKLGSEKH